VRFLSGLRPSSEATLRFSEHWPRAALVDLRDHRLRLALAHGKGPDQDRRRVRHPGPPRAPPCAGVVAQRGLGALHGPEAEGGRSRDPQPPAHTADGPDEARGLLR
jgi:hypothetical protein